MNNSQKGASSNAMYIVVAIVLVLGGLILFSRMNSTEAPTQDQVAIEETVTGSGSDDSVMEDDKDTSPSGAMTADGDSNEDEDGDEVKTFQVEAGGFYYKPAEIRVKKGDTVKIVLNNVKGMHDWVIDEFDARTKILNAGETETIEFIADKVGTFEYYCSVGNHRAQGMVGNLIVE